MVHYAYSNNGDSWRGIEPDWELAEGEIRFDHEATDDELNAAFPGRVAASLASFQASALRDLNQQAQAIADQLTAGYPEFEKLTWEDQRREALAWNADNSTPTPYINVLATERGIDRTDYLRRTVAKTTAFASAAQKLVGQRQKYEDQIKAIKIEDGEADEKPAVARVAAIKFVFTLE